ncbi:MAG TPA: fructose-bisphosphate aldolase class I [Candidatus Paceibacterota bacterium]|nr:fructose-bisphosphate aldolase class I [Candidatus Paceibacterota bacterium]HMP19074.1 fructose-bisphosphate aldolase class I [Candidatus Paceibacterota bacterium]HMP85424.1 fructose-bisphosphate aldolase class I [Candidatus Paceibacterota bacterium]
MLNENIKNILLKTVSQLMSPQKGILAADESNETAGKRLADYEISNSEENRRLYRELFFATTEIEKYVSGIIMYDETFWQKSNSGINYPQFLQEKGIVPGIKVDLGAKDFPNFPGEKITVGLDDLSIRAQKYFDNGARFAKWRAVIKIDQENNLPTEACIDANCDAVAKYVGICQSIGLVPIVEPEVLILGNHSIEKSYEVTSAVLQKLFEKLKLFNAFIPGLILKTSMIIQGDQNPNESSPQKIAEETVRVLKENVPVEIGGVVFLSGGQTSVEATAHFDAIVEFGGLDFEIAFSYARALQESALRIWKGKDENVDLARREFLKRLKLNTLADSGDYDIKLEYLE